MSSTPAPAVPPGNPTPAQIQQVQTNLINIQAWNDYVYSKGNPALFSDAFGLLSYNDNNDLGLTVGLDVMTGVCSAVGGLGGPVGTFIGSFLPGMLANWATAPPPNLAETFGGLAVRLEQMSVAFDQQLATYIANVPEYWDQTFPYNGNTVALSDLADIVVPAEADPAFYAPAHAGLFALDQWIWKSVMLEKFVLTQFLVPGAFVSPTCNNSPVEPITCVQGYYQENPAYYLSSVYWGPSPGGVSPFNPNQTPPNVWCFTVWNIGTGVDFGYPIFGDGGMSVPACEHLFIDSTPGVTINSSGLYLRSEVFTGLGLRTKTCDSPPRPTSL